MKKYVIKLVFASFILCISCGVGVCETITNAVVVAEDEFDVVEQMINADEKKRLLNQYDGSITNTVVTADYMEYDYEKMTAELKNNVKIKDSRIYMESDLIRIFFYKDNSIKSISAIGNVKVVQNNKIALSDKALYFGNEGKILMLGDAFLIRDYEFMKGIRITFFIDNQRVICEPGMLVFRPGKYTGENSSMISTNEAALFDDFGDK
ncbi:MAG: hypothetical protein PF692_12975 [Kiritimatiellae bacterium]|jgi:lipopolysaccharide transport protein LptA|nr:hypothetical protein [Kiritimatiellia bacterium]